MAFREMTIVGQWEWARSLVVMVAIGAVVGWAGPFGSDLNYPLLVQLAYWMVAIPLIGVIARVSIRAVSRSEPGSSWKLPIQALAGAAFTGIPGTFIATGLQTMFGFSEGAHLGFSLAKFATQYLSVTMIVAAIGIPWHIINSLRERAADQPLAVAHSTLIAATAPVPLDETAVSSPLPSPFLHRIPARLGPDLLYLSAEDHYLRVTTTVGSELLLFRFSDAIAELGPALGRQVHRSYWVARSAVAEVKRDAGRVSLRLKDGSHIPVSKTYLASLRDGGWLTDSHPKD
jgi:hypothetical protein